MNGDVHLVSDFNARELHQSSIEDDPLRVADFSDGLGHDVILCFTERGLSKSKGGEANQEARLQRMRSNQSVGGFDLRCFRLVSRQPPAALDRYPGGVTGHVARPGRSIRTGYGATGDV